LLRGETLEARLQRQDEPALAEILRVGREIAEGLAAAHALGLMHRDIKPANIWLEARGQESGVSGQADSGHLVPSRVKILDFGLARGADEAGVTQSDVIAGTPAYMAPEQARGEPGPRSDLFSLGCVLYRMATRRLPFAGATTMAILQALAVEQPQPPGALNPALPKALSDLILKLLAKDPKDRPQTAGEVASALETIARDEVARSNGRSRRRLPTLLFSVVGLVTLGIAGWLNGPAVYRFTTNQGVIVIETDDPDVEVTCRGDVVRVVDVKTGHEVTIKAGKYRLELTKGKPGLQLSTKEFTLERGGKQIVKVTMAPIEQVAKEPFVVLARDGRAEQKFASLADAVGAAQGGDTIEIRDNGPFVLQPIDLRDKPLTLRAGAGAWPVLSLAPEAVAADLPLLTTRAALALEGLEFQRDGGGKPGATSVWHIHARRSPLAVANCRFVLAKNRGLISAITAGFSPAFQVRNCLFLGDWHAGPNSHLAPDGRTTVANCLFLTRSCALTFHIQEDIPTASLQVLNNTMISHAPPVGFSIGSANALKKVSAPPLRLEARQNIGTAGFLGFLYYSASKETDAFLDRELTSLAPRLVALEDQGNHVAAGSPLVTSSMLPHAGGERFKPTIATLEQYKEFWKLKKTDSILAPVRFQKDLSPKMSAPEKLSPEDFRVHESGDKGPGADVDLVGPGPAYERWRKTPAYQQWLKDSEQVVRAPTPIVVLAKGGRAEQKFAALPDAVAAAQNADTIEIRGNGPFVLQPIQLADKPLTLRAGAGFWPVLSLAPEAVAADLPLLTTRAALSLEGLEFHRDAGGKAGATGLMHIYSERAPLAVANCRFVLPSKHPGLIDAITAENSPSFHVHNCLFLGDWHAGPASNRVVPGARTVVVNSLFLTRGYALTFAVTPPQEEVPTASLQVLNNTMISRGGGPVAISISVRKAHKDVQGQKPPFRLEARRNLGGVGWLHFMYFSFSKESDEFLEREMRSLPSRLFTVEDQGNHIAAGSPLVTFRMLKDDQRKDAVTTLEEFKKYWKLGKTESSVGPIRFRKDLWSRTLAPEKRSPEDFRVEADGPAFKGLGADVDLVGPGPAYEQWRKTPAYQQWLNDTGTQKK
jgi:hypothetical protein